MDMLTEHNDVIKGEDNISFDQEFITTEDINYHNTLYHSSLPKDIDAGENTFEVEKDDLDHQDFKEKMASVQPLPRDVAIDGIKLECDDSDKQGKTNQKHLTNNDMFGGSTTTKDFVIDEIKFENDNEVTQGKINTEDKIDYGLECEKITTEDFVTDNINVKIKQEIITNIDMICRSSLPTDVGFNSVKVETCAVIKKDGVNESAANADVKREDIFMGEDYSSDDGFPSAETPSEVTEIPNDSTQVKVDTRRGTAADGGLTVNKLSPDINPKTSCKPQLLNHLKAHAALQKDRSFSCEVCLKTFSKKYSLIEHLRIHSGEKPFSCEVCLKTFIYKSSLTCHMRTHSRKRQFSCEVCLKTYRKKYSLIEHLRIHSGEKPISCLVCLKTFRTRSSLTFHMRTHSGKIQKKPFLCEACQKTFYIRADLSRHIMMTHSGKKPFSCKVCHNTFYDKANLRRHMRIHSGEKSFLCEVCHKTFSYRYCLIRHMRTHSGEKPFSCKICHKTFHERANLSRHMRTHSREKPFSCGVYHKTFSQREDFVIDDIKFENDDAVTQGKINTEDVIDYDSKYETITTKDFVADNIKVKIKQEIITAEDFTNIDMKYRSSLPTDVGYNTIVKVENCAGMKKDGLNENAINADVKREDIFMDAESGDDRT